MTSTVVSNGSGRGLQRKRATGATAGAREHFVDGRTTGVLDQFHAEVLLKRLVGAGRSPLEDGMGVVGHVLDLYAGHWRHSGANGAEVQARTLTVFRSAALCKPCPFVSLALWDGRPPVVRGDIGISGAEEVSS